MHPSLSSDGKRAGFACRASWGEQGAFGAGMSLWDEVGDVGHWCEVFELGVGGCRSNGLPDHLGAAFPKR